MSAATGDAGWSDIHPPPGYGIPTTPIALTYAHLGEQQADPDSFEHPDWCDRSWCTAHRRGGDHWSVPWRIEPPERTGFPLFELALWAGAYEPATTAPVAVEMRLIHMSMGRTLAVEAYEMETGQMRELATALVEMADRADTIGERTRQAQAAAHGDEGP